MVKISVIIPVYNTEDYLKECLDSITHQTLQDIEIICVNDGSTDNSLNILKEYAKKDNRINIITQKNSGQGVARNNAMKHIKGKYFCFMDADDILDLETLEKCYLELESKNLELVMFKLINFEDGSNKYYTTPLYDMYNVHQAIKNKIFSYEDLGELIFNLSVTPVNKVYKTSFVRKNNVSFPDDIIFEDNVFFWELLFKTKRMYFIDEYYYKRRRHASSTTSLGNERWCDSIEVYNRVWNIFEKNNEFEKFKHKLYNNKVTFALFRFDNILPDAKEIFYLTWKEDLKSVSKKYGDFYLKLTETNKQIYDLVTYTKNYQEFEFFRNNLLLSEKIIMIEEKQKKMNYKISALMIKNNEIKENNEKLLLENKKLSHEKNSLIHENNDLKEKNNRLTEINNSILNSRSWRFMKPFRYLKQLIKGNI